MPEAALMQSLAQRLLHSAQQQDWAALAVADRELAQLLARLERRALSGAERDRVPALRAAHRMAAQCCQQQQAQLARELAQWQDSRSGWLAYAQSADME